MNNPYGIANLWQQGDSITRAVAIVLLIMSILSWYVMIIKAIGLVRLRGQAAAAAERFWHCKTMEEGLATLGANREASPFRALAEDGVNAARHHAQSTGD